MEIPLLVFPARRPELFNPLLDMPDILRAPAQHPRKLLGTIHRKISGRSLPNVPHFFRNRLGHGVDEFFV